MATRENINIHSDGNPLSKVSHILLDLGLVSGVSIYVSNTSMGNFTDLNPQSSTYIYIIYTIYIYIYV